MCKWCLLETHLEHLDCVVKMEGEGLLKDSKYNSQADVCTSHSKLEERVKMSPSGSSLTGPTLILLSCQHDLKVMHKYTEQESSVTNSDVSKVHAAQNRAAAQRHHHGAIHWREVLTSDVSARGQHPT